MSKVDDWLLDGSITEHEENPDLVVFAPKILLAKELVNAGGVELAVGKYGWTEQAKDEMGNNIGPNPITPLQFATSILKNFCLEVFTAATIDKATAQAKAAALAQVEALKN